VNTMIPADDGDGMIPLLSLAARMGHEQACRMLTDAGANISGTDTSNGFTALHELVAEDDGFTGPSKAKCVRCLLDAGAAVHVNTRDEFGWSPFAIACEASTEDVVRLLIQYGANLTMEIRGRTPLLLAVRRGRRDVVLTLLRAGAPWQALTHHLIKPHNVVLNDFMITLMNAGGWEKRVEKHHRSLMGVLSHIALPRDALLVVLSYWSPPGGH